MKNQIMFSITLLTALSADGFQLARAGDLPSGQSAGKDNGECKYEGCKKTRPTCFNLYCVYQKDGDRCEAAATFNHFVTDEGRETWGNSTEGNNPVYSVSCGGHSIYSGSGHRYTDRLGTRIQGIPGPFPAIVLPVGALKELRHYSESTLETRDETYLGTCYIYTGPAFL